MKFSFAFITLIFLSFSSFAFVKAPSLPGSALKASDCSHKARNTLSDMREISCKLDPSKCVHKAGWNPSRDNTMVPAESDVGLAMATIYSANGASQAIQVCPGVYLASAHGVLDKPEDATKEGRALRSPLENISATRGSGVLPYPISPNNILRPSSDSDFISPRLRDPRSWDNRSTDYVFIKVSNPSRPDNFVEPINISVLQAERYYGEGSLKAHLYRPSSDLKFGDDGLPITKRGVVVHEVRTEPSQILEDYKIPQKVQADCRLSQSVYSSLISTNCPSEKGVSGSSLISRINGKPYAIGVLSSGTGKIDEAHVDGNDFVSSEVFCSDYEQACGKPCKKFNPAELDPAA